MHCAGTATLAPGSSGGFAKYPLNNNFSKISPMRELWLARNTVIEMVKDRDYNTSVQPLSYGEFTVQYPSVQSNPSSLNFIATKDSPIAVHFTREDKLSKKGLESLVHEYGAQGVSSVILITFSKLNPACRALLKGIKLSFEHFMVEELQFNPTKHVLVPRHRIMTQTESQALVKSLRCEKSNLPTILTTDVISRYFGAQCGDVVEIVRNSQTTGTALYYRVVREPSVK